MRLYCTLCRIKNKGQKHRIKAIVAEALIGQQIAQAQPISSARCGITLSQLGYFYYLFFGFDLFYCVRHGDPKLSSTLFKKSLKPVHYNVNVKSGPSFLAVVLSADTIRTQRSWGLFCCWRRARAIAGIRKTETQA